MSYQEFRAGQQQRDNPSSSDASTHVAPSVARSPHGPSSPQHSAAPMEISVAELVKRKGRRNIKRLDPTLKDGIWFGYTNHITKSIKKMFHTFLDRGYAQYNDIPQSKREQFFRCFWQEFDWDSKKTDYIRILFHDRARLSYIKTMGEWKKKWKQNKTCPSKLEGKTTLWRELVAYWQTEAAKKVLKRQSQNRMSDRGGKGPATHNGGATSDKQRRLDLEIENGVEPDYLTVMVDRHTNKKTKRIQDQVVAEYVEKIKEKAEAWLSQLGVDVLMNDEINKLAEETIPIVKNRRIGLGKPSEYKVGPLADSTLLRSQAIEQEIVTLRETLAEKSADFDSLKAYNEKMADFLRKEFGEKCPF